MDEPLKDDLVEARLKRVETKLQELVEAVDELLRWMREEAPVDRCIRVA